MGLHLSFLSCFLAVGITQRPAHAPPFGVVETGTVSVDTASLPWTDSLSCLSGAQLPQGLALVPSAG